MKAIFILWEKASPLFMIPSMNVVEHRIPECIDVCVSDLLAHETASSLTLSASMLRAYPSPQLVTESSQGSTGYINK